MKSSFTVAGQVIVYRKFRIVDPPSVILEISISNCVRALQCTRVKVYFTKVAHFYIVLCVFSV